MNEERIPVIHRNLPHTNLVWPSWLLHACCSSSVVPGRWWLVPDYRDLYIEKLIHGKSQKELEVCGQP
jgi:hypothetical protein